MLLEIKQLSVSVGLSGNQILHDVDLSVDDGMICALVGGSGSGKSTTGLAVMRLLSPALSVRRGAIGFEERDLLLCSEREMRGVRGGRIGMVFQEPLDAFNPVYRVGEQIAEVLQFHSDTPASARAGRVLELLERVGVPAPGRIAASYPHQLSGGLRQRAMIAQAIAARPRLIIADEPTSSLDVTLQARVLELFRKLKEEEGLSILLITHDLGVVRHLADEVTVLRQGRVVEAGAVADVLSTPGDDYTRSLLAAVELEA